MFFHKFSVEKAVQSINYYIQHFSKHDHLDKLVSLKLMFLADRYHLRRYGRMITNDEYWAMEFGPVPSSVKDIVEMTDCLSPYERKYSSTYLKRYKKHQVASIADPDMDVLSESDVEALNSTLDISKRQRNLVKFTHMFPEWKNHEHEIGPTTARVKMNMLDCFETAPNEVEYCEVPEDILQLHKEFFQEELDGLN